MLTCGQCLYILKSMPHDKVNIFGDSSHLIAIRVFMYVNVKCVYVMYYQYLCFGWKNVGNSLTSKLIKNNQVVNAP